MTAALEPASRTVFSQGLTLHYLDWGNEDAPLLILIHGNRDHARSWDWTAQALRTRYHVVAVDLRGHGDSGWSPDGAYLMPYHVLDLVALIEHLGVQTMTIVGHSFGGAVAWRYAGLYPNRVERLVVVDGLGPDPRVSVQWTAAGIVSRQRDWIAQRMEAWTKPPRRLPSVEAGIERMAAANPRLSPDQVRHLAEHGLRLHPDGYGWKYDPMVGMFAPEDFGLDHSQYWRAVTAPTLLLYGEKSWTTNPEEDGRAAYFADQRTVVFPEAGHWIHHDAFDDFIGCVAGFLNED